MPIEIRELIINASVNTEQPAQTDTTFNVDGLAELKKEIIAESVEQVLTIIQNKTER